MRAIGVKDMAPVKNRPVFNEALLPEGKKTWGSFSAGLGLECCALVAVIVIPMLIPAKFEAAPHYWVTQLEAPVIQPWKPQPPPPPKNTPVKKVVIKEPPKPEVVEVPKPKIYNTVFSAPVVKPVVPKKVTNPDPVDVAKEFPTQSLGSSAIPTLKKPREAVQTGGFGDPNGLPANNNTSRNPNVALQGGFDMPTGAGVGNGTGGAKGAKGVVASTGFGNGVAVGGNGGGAHGQVQQGLFADEKVADAPRVKQAAAVSNTNPVEILSRPKPVYTDEGRAKKIEGDVLVQVVFKASGEVQVERVVRGLGYGLDESAEAAAREIKFKPATQNGQAVDFPAVAHITFELAY
jgi:TonB family protein